MRHGGHRGAARLLLKSGELITSRLGARLTLKRVADIDTTKDRGLCFAAGVLIDDAWAVVNDPAIDIVVEMIGGETIAKDLILNAIENGKQIVTANKALLAAHGNAILEAPPRKRGSITPSKPASAGACP
ncbi:MAG: hypothetical protein U5R30_12875 [Deltaproteobacteria bacterium]|nr:hypothetical protein [Deltaproteobacteria bacterium]